METQNNTDPKIEAGKKKTRFDLICAWLLASVARVFTGGAEKYGDKTYLHAGWENRDTYFASIHRHLNAIQLDEWMDKESGEPHVAHIMANCQILHEIYNFDVQMQSGFLEAEIAEVDGTIREMELNNTLAEQETQQSPVGGINEVQPETKGDSN